MFMQLLIVAKRPEPGRAKTRLIPWAGEAGAAALASAALADTFDAARGSRADQVVVAFDGDPAGVVPHDVVVVPQGDGDLAERLTDAWRHVSGPAFQIGMDTPQLRSADLDAAMDRLEEPGVDAVLGPAIDGGWWSIGLRHRRNDIFSGIATSRSDTGANQAARLRKLGLTTMTLPVHRDVDHPADAVAVAALAPGTRFAATVDEMQSRTPLPHLTSSARR
jgi:rSAM/selenodomain-associated transferase 1